MDSGLEYVRSNRKYQKHLSAEGWQEHSFGRCHTIDVIEQANAKQNWEPRLNLSEEPRYMEDDLVSWADAQTVGEKLVTKESDEFGYRVLKVAEQMTIDAMRACDEGRYKGII